MSASLVLTVTRLPTYQILFCVFFSSFIISSIMTTITKSWGKLAAYPWYLWVVGVVCIFGNEALYVTSFKYAPAAQVDIINYLWPLLVIVLTPILPKEKLRVRNIFAVLVAFVGVFVMLSMRHHGMGEILPQYIYGYCSAFVAALLWAIYTLVARAYGKSTPELIGVYCGFCAAAAAYMHIGTEEFVMPTAREIAALLIMGGTTHSLAYVLWDKAVKYGDFQLLSILSYANPILSVCILFTLGYAESSSGVLLAGLCVFIAGVVSITPWYKLYQIIQSALYEVSISEDSEEQYEL